MYQFFYPRSICIIGASSKVNSIGHEILNSVKSYGFTGSVFPVNPKADKILGYKCFKSVNEIKENIDLAIVVVPKLFVKESLKELIEKKVVSVILITAGFAETGKLGKKLEQEIAEELTQHNIRMVGPNCMGIINTDDAIKLNATFVAEKPKKGGIGFLSQSGALGAAVLNSLRNTDIRFAHFISIGNKADISEIDLLRFWMTDDNIKTIAFYLESFDNGLELIKLYQNSKSKKPLIILKSGKTESGMKAASSHTGALSSNEKIIDALLDQFGIIRVNTINEMFNTAKVFEHFPIPLGNRIAIVTNAGGPAILAVDKLEEKNLKLAEISEKTKNRLKDIVHPEGSINNPVDLLPGGSPEIYKKVNEIIIEDDNIDAVISIFVEPVMVDALETIEKVNSIISSKPIYQVCMPLPEFWEKYSNISQYRKPVFRNPEEPSVAISNILHYEKKKIKVYDFFSAEKGLNKVYRNEEFLKYNEVIQICSNYEIPLVKQKLFSSQGLLSNYDLGFPLVLKGISKKVIHKSDFNAVKLNIKNANELFDAIDEIKNIFSQNNKPVEQFLIQKFIEIKHELFIGGFRDNSFGPVVVFGSGGKYVEILDDTRIKSAYLTDEDVIEMINFTKIGRIIKGVRGEKEVDIKKLMKIIKSIAKLMIENKQITEIDINPLAIDMYNEFHAVDIRIKVNNS